MYTCVSSMKCLNWNQVGGRSHQNKMQIVKMHDNAKTKLTTDYCTYFFYDDGKCVLDMLFCIKKS